MKNLYYSVEAKFRELDEIGKSVKKDMGNIKTQTTGLIQVLESELRIVTVWKNNAEKMDGRLDTLSLDKFDRLPLYRKSFLRAVVALRKSAEDFLDQPIVLFTLEEDEEVVKGRKAWGYSECQNVENCSQTTMTLFSFWKRK